MFLVIFCIFFFISFIFDLCCICILIISLICHRFIYPHISSYSLCSLSCRLSIFASFINSFWRHRSRSLICLYYLFTILTAPRLVLSVFAQLRIHLRLPAFASHFVQSVLACDFSHPPNVFQVVICLCFYLLLLVVILYLR